MCQNHKYRNEILNHRFGKLIAVEYVGQSANQKRSLWKCKCDCGNEKIVRSDCLRQKTVTSCGCLAYLTGNNSKCWGGYGEISGSYWGRLQSGAKKRNIEFKITIEYCWDLFSKQNRKCVLSGIELSFGKMTKNFKLKTASLDRIDSTKGYIEDNVQWIDKRINFMKQAFPQIEFIELCNLISCHYHKNNESVCQIEKVGVLPT